MMPQLGVVGGVEGDGGHVLLPAVLVQLCCPAGDTNYCDKYCEDDEDDDDDCYHRLCSKAIVVLSFLDWMGSTLTLV